MRIRLVAAVACVPLLFAAPGCAPAGGESVNADQPLRVGAAADAQAGVEGWSTSVSWWTEDRPETSFGVDVCLQGVTAARITSIAPLDTVGDVDVLDPLLMTTTDPNDPVLYVDSYPPASSDAATFEPLAGAAFTYQCGARPPFQQIIVGLRGESSEGGGWEGIMVTYESEGETHELRVPIGMLMCGESTDPCGDS